MAATTWADAYLVSPTSTGGAPPTTTTRSLSSRRPVVFDFSTIDADSIPDEVWEEVQRSEREEIEKRDAFLKECEQSMYEAGRRLAAKMPSATLRNGSRMPLIGLGTWKAERGEVKRAVEYAVRAGYRHIDCASVYQNEDEVGDAIGYVLERGLVEREELFVCSKVWNTDHAAARVRKACEASLKALKVDYLDLYLIHWPVTGNVGDEVSPSVRETWEAMESLVRDGLVRSIGTSNFSAKKLADIASYATVQPSVCQVEVHPYHRNDALLSFCADRGIHVTAFSPLGSPDSESIFPRAVPDAVLMRDPRVLRVAESTGKNVGQVLIRWALQHGTSVIPKSTNPSRIAGNLDVLDWELSASDYALLSSMAFQMRMVNGGMWLNPRGPYRTMEDLWDEPETAMTSEAFERDLAAATATDALEGGTAGNTDETTTAPAPQLFSPKGRAKSEARSESNSESHTTDNAARRLSHPIALSPANSSEGSENDYHSVTESPAVPSLTEKVASFSKWMGFSR